MTAKTRLSQIKGGIFLVIIEFIGQILNTFHDFHIFIEAFSIPMPYMGMEYCYERALLKTLDCGEAETCPSPLSQLKEDRPRERLIRFGPQSLSDEELLSIILVSGIQGKNVSLLARELLSKLEAEKKMPKVSELCRLSGLGISKACTISAMLEFGRRKWASGQRIRHPEDIYNLIRHHADRRQEKFISISLNGAHEVLAIRIVTIGLVNRAIIHPREVLADPIQDRASSIAVAHNHPSGNLQPSMEDRKITQRLKDASEILGLNFLDHLIFSDTGLFSFRREGLILEKEKKPMDEIGWI